jgi:hypothetical protein
MRRVGLSKPLPLLYKNESFLRVWIVQRCGAAARNSPPHRSGVRCQRSRHFAFVRCVEIATLTRSPCSDPEGRTCHKNTPIPGTQRFETHVASGSITTLGKVVGRAVAIRMQMQIEDLCHNTKVSPRP